MSGRWSAVEQGVTPFGAAGAHAQWLPGGVGRGRSLARQGPGRSQATRASNQPQDLLMERIPWRGSMRRRHTHGSGRKRHLDKISVTANTPHSTPAAATIVATSWEVLRIVCDASPLGLF